MTTTTFTPTLDTYIQAQRPNQKITIFTQKGDSDLTDWNNVHFYHKNLGAPNITILRKSLSKYRHSGFKIQTTGLNYHDYIIKNLKKMAQHQHSWKSQLNKASSETLFDLLYRCPSIITDPTARARTTYRIKSVMKRRFGLAIIPSFTVSYPYDHKVNTADLKGTISQIIDASRLTQTIKDHIKLQLRIVNTARKNIARMLVNANQHCTSFDPDKEPECIQHET